MYIIKNGFVIKLYIETIAVYFVHFTSDRNASLFVVTKHQLYRQTLHNKSQFTYLCKSRECISQCILVTVSRCFRTHNRWECDPSSRLWCVRGLTMGIIRPKILYAHNSQYLLSNKNKTKKSNNNINYPLYVQSSNLVIKMYCTVQVTLSNPRLLVGTNGEHLAYVYK